MSLETILSDLWRLFFLELTMTCWST